MRKILLCISLGLTPAMYAQIGGSATVGGTSVITPGTAQAPTIVDIVPATTANTIEANFVSKGVATAGMDCETTAGPYTGHPSVDMSVLTGVGAMQQIVAGLVPSTFYYCQITTNPPVLTNVGAIPSPLTANWTLGTVAITNAPLVAGTLSTVTLQFYTAPSAGQAIPCGIFAKNSTNDFTATSSFTLNAAATTAAQTFTSSSGVPATVITSGQFIGCIGVTGTSFGYVTSGGTYSDFYLNSQTGIPVGAQTYGAYGGSVAISAVISVAPPGGSPQTATFTATTNALPTSTAITSLSYSTPATYNSINVSNIGNADTFANAISNDGVNYFTNDDTGGFTQSGVGGCSTGGAISLAKFTTISPLAGISINCFVAYGNYSGTAPDGFSQKDSGLFAMSGYLFMTLGRHAANPPSTPAYPQVAGQVVWTPDYGKTWNNFQNLTPFLPNGSPSAPANASMFGTTPTTMGSCAFTMYGPDTGDLGYLSPYTQVDNANAYVYLTCNEGTWNGGGTGGGGNAFYLARVARAKLSRLRATDYQWFTGGDGSLDTNWTSTQTSAVAMLSNYGELGEPAVNYIPTRGSYLLTTFYYPSGTGSSGGNTANCVWLSYTASHPWGPWTLINTTTWATQGYYNPYPIMGSGLLTGLTSTILFTGDYTANYHPYYATMTLN